MSPDSKPLVLVVDDDETIRRVLRAAFEREGLDVLLAEDGVQALIALSKTKRRVAVILADVVMPEMGGVELAERVMAHPHPPRILLMSGIVHDPSKIRVGTQALPFIQKPFNIPGLMKLIRREAAQGG